MSTSSIWKERHSPWHPLWIVAVDGSQGEDRLALHDWHGTMTGQNFHHPSPRVTVPKGRWFNLTVLYEADPVNGQIKLWLDGKLLVSLEGVRTMKPSASSNAFMWGVGNYGWPAIGTDHATPSGIYVDNVDVWKVP